MWSTMSKQEERHSLWIGVLTGMIWLIGFVVMIALK